MRILAKRSKSAAMCSISPRRPAACTASRGWPAAGAEARIRAAKASPKATEPATHREDDMPTQLNVYGEPIEECCSRPMTGFYRNGNCDTGPEDLGVHSVCVRVTAEFL